MFSEGNGVRETRGLDVRAKTMIDAKGPLRSFTELLRSSYTEKFEKHTASVGQQQ